MKKIVYSIIILVIFFSSCYSVKRMNNQVVKGYNTYPVEFTQTVSNLLPVKETTIRTVDTIYKPGNTIFDTAYIKADCDTVKINKDGKKIVYIPGKLRVDTVYINTKDSVIVKDTRELTAVTNKLNAANVQISKKDTTINIMKWSLISLGGLIILFLIAKRIPFLKNII